MVIYIITSKSYVLPSFLLGIVFLGFCVCAFTSISQFYDPMSRLNVSDTSEKICINGNWTATKVAGICSGLGTPEDPYLIQNKIIDADGSGSCIIICNAYEYFIIENCTLYNSGTIWGDAGINIENGANGRIIKNSISNNYFGIYISMSRNINITRNSIVSDRGVNYNFNCTDMWLYLNNFVCPIFALNFVDFNSTTYHTPTQFLYTYTYNNNNFTNYLGNYWHDHNGEDENGDGIAENPLIFTGGTIDPIVYEVDKYPLMGNHNNYILIEPWFPSEQKIPGYQSIIIVGIVALISLVVFRKWKQNRSL